MTTFYWTVHFKGTCLDGTRLDRVFKGDANSEKDVDIGVMLQELIKFVGKEHHQLGVTQIEAKIRRPQKRNNTPKGEKKP